MSRNRWRRLLCAAFLVLASPSALAADKTSSDWGALSALRPGDSVQVVDDSLKTWEGSLLSVSPDGIAIRVRTGALRTAEKWMRRESVVRVSRVNRGRNTLIGLGAGLAAGAALSAWAAQRIDKGYGGAITKGQATALFLGAMGGAGAGIGYAIPHLETLYRRPAAEPTGQ
jgi:hypothetical protein